MLIVTSRHTQQMRETRRDAFAAETEIFLREHFRARLMSLTSEEVYRAIVAGIPIGRGAGLTRSRDIQIYLACACVCGLYMFTDPRCYWLFGEGEERWSIHDDVAPDIERVAHTLDTDQCIFFNENPMNDYECRVWAAEREFSRTKDLRKSLLTLTPKRYEFIHGTNLAEFVGCAQNAARLAKIDDFTAPRYTLLAWLLGIQFMDDPLCRPAHEFLRDPSRC